MTRNTASHLPRIVFEHVSPPRGEMLPRMDVAVFVGFAADGPLHKPEPVESIAQYTSTFGSDLPLAWDIKKGERLYAYLGPAVRHYFSNGGRRCWVIRVEAPAKRDGNVRFSAKAFLDHDLKDEATEKLIAHADFLRYQSS